MWTKFSRPGTGSLLRYDDSSRERGRTNTSSQVTSGSSHMERKNFIYFCGPDDVHPAAATAVAAGVDGAADPGIQSSAATAHSEVLSVLKVRNGVVTSAIECQRWWPWWKVARFWAGSRGPCSLRWYRRRYHIQAWKEVQGRWPIGDKTRSRVGEAAVSIVLFLPLASLLLSRLLVFSLLLSRCPSGAVPAARRSSPTPREITDLSERLTSRVAIVEGAERRLFMMLMAVRR